MTLPATRSGLTVRPTSPSATVSAGTTRPVRPAEASRPGRWPGRSLLASVVGSLVGGLVLATAFPPYGWWISAPLAVGLLALCWRGRSVRVGAGLGAVAGLAFFVPLLSWLAVVGVDAWLLLAVVEASFVAALGAGVAAVSRLPGWPAWTACLWVAEEALRDRVPLGGFPWGRLGFAAAGSPLAPYAALGGVPLVSFVVALVGVLVAAALVGAGRRRLLPVALAVLAGGGGLAVPVPTAGSAAGGPAYATVALVQGDVPRSGLDAFGQRAAVLDHHVAATEALAREVRAGRVPAPQAVIWPENATDLDPYADPAAAAAIDRAVRAVGVPVLVGAVIGGPGPDHVRNTGIVWNPRTGPGPMYVKRHPVPFGEYVPFRSVIGSMVGRLSRVPADFAAGRRPGVLTVGPVRLGDVICFEIAYDGLVADAVRAGGRVIVVQTNNATYGRSAETHQQLAMSRLRAVEHGRAVLVAATSGISAVVAPDGSVRQQTTVFTARSLVDRIPLRDALTVADRVRTVPEWTLTLVGLGALGVAGARSRRRRGEAE